MYENPPRKCIYPEKAGAERHKSRRIRNFKSVLLEHVNALLWVWSLASSRLLAGVQRRIMNLEAGGRAGAREDKRSIRASEHPIPSQG
jgi:hypothetical protein